MPGVNGYNNTMKNKFLKIKIICTEAYQVRKGYISYTVGNWSVNIYLFGILINSIKIEGVNVGSIKRIVPNYDVIELRGLINEHETEGGGE